MEVGWVCQSSVGAAGVGWAVKEGNRRAEGKKLLAGCVWESCIMGWNLVGRERQVVPYIKIMLSDHPCW